MNLDYWSWSRRFAKQLYNDGFKPNLCVWLRRVWIENVQEYDIEIKPTKLVRGNELYKSLAEDQQYKEEDTLKVLMVSLQDPCFSNISYFMTYGECSDGFTKKRRDLKIKGLQVCDS